MTRPKHYIKPRLSRKGVLFSTAKKDQSQASPISRCPTFHNIDRCIEGFKNGFPDTTIRRYHL